MTIRHIMTVSWQDYFKTNPIMNKLPNKVRRKMLLERLFSNMIEQRTCI